MFRHSDLNNNNGTNDDLQNKIDRSIRYFNVPNMLNKQDVLDHLLRKITEQEEPAVHQTKVRKIYYAVSSAAAVGLILFALYFFFAFETYTGGTQQASNVFYLPDNSRVILTKGTSIRFSKIAFNREVKLKGEAYFEISSGEGFMIDSREGSVEVLGTRFRVNDQENTLLVQCYHGLVGVHYANDNVQISEGMLLKGENNQVQVTEGNGNGYPEYAHFKYSCKNLKLNDIWPEIEQYFGVTIQTEINDFEKSFTGSISTGNINNVLDIICTSMKLDYSISEDKQVFITSRN
ncbi:MAG: FecR family protein [Prolixibacteraceae bacterium]|nr:FecR family protein [Prolixibacteraceae bacterium]MBN2648710.1 FecR family protein [Prolixibacteraceae bacterium]